MCSDSQSDPPSAGTPRPAMDARTPGEVPFAPVDPVATRRHRAAVSRRYATLFKPPWYFRLLVYLRRRLGGR